MQELASNITALYKFHSFTSIPILTGLYKIRFPEIRAVCLQELANKLCAGDRANAANNLISTIRGLIHGNPDSNIDPETRDVLFDTLTKGYARTVWGPYVPPVSCAIRPTLCEHPNPSG